jgi:hypothetical protein
MTVLSSAELVLHSITYFLSFSLLSFLSLLAPLVWVRLTGQISDCSSVWVASAQFVV